MRGVTCVWAAVVFAVAAALGAGCFRGEFANCKITCATTADCPGGLSCNAQSYCSNGGGACSATPDADLTKPQPLTVVKAGEGTITSDPAGIDCGTTCSAEFPPLSSVTLTAMAASSSVFDGWTGDCSGTTNTCSVSMDGPKAVEAQFALHGAKRWVKQISFSGSDFESSEIAVDANGDVIAAGMIDDQGSSGFYVVKYASATGDVLWEKKILAPGYFFIVGGLDTDANDNVYMCARMQGNGTPIMVGSASVTGDLFGNVLAVRLAAATGEVDWAKSWGGDAQEECEGVAVSGTNVFFTGGTSSNPSNFGSVVLTAAVDNAYIVRAATSNGAVQTGRLLAATFDIHDIAENAGQIAIAGSFVASNYAFDACNLSSSGSGDDGMIINFTNNLVCTWTRSYGSITNGQDTVANAIAPVPGGGWVVAGRFEGSVTFPGAGTTLVNQGMRDAFIARYANDGAHVWSFGYGSSGNDIGRGVAVTATGETVFIGEFNGTLTFGSSQLTTTNSDLFITRLTPGPTPIHQWAVRVGGTASEFLHGVRVDAQGTVSVLTTWSGMTEVSGTPLTAQDSDAWVGSFVR